VTLSQAVNECSEQPRKDIPHEYGKGYLPEAKSRGLLDRLIRLLFALLIDGKQYIFADWRDVAKRRKVAPPMTAQEKIRRKMERGPVTLHELKNSTTSRHFTREQWDKALQGLAEAGELQVTIQRTLSGRTRKVVIPARVDAA
jgi:hypothetical protein